MPGAPHGGRVKQILRRVAGFMAVSLAVGLSAATAPIKHEFIAIDEGLATLLHVDENDPAKDWKISAPHPTPRDMQLIGGGRVLIGHDAGYSDLIRIWDHKILLEHFLGMTRYTDDVEIHAGPLTAPAWLFAQLFYFHRQRRLNRLVMAGFAY